MTRYAIQIHGAGNLPEYVWDACDGWVFLTDAARAKVFASMTEAVLFAFGTPLLDVKPTWHVVPVERTEAA